MNKWLYGYMIFSLLLVVSFLLVAKPVRASETTYYLGALERTYNDSGALVNEKVYIGAGNATVVKTSNKQQAISNKTEYLYADYLGSTVLITKADGTKESSLQYYPYGNSVGAIHELPLQTDKLYTSQRRDSSSDLYFYNARYYNPTTGNFISADKAEGPNRYAYVGNNPIMRNDPSGNMVGCRGEKCNRMFPGLKEASEKFPKTTQSIKSTGDFLKSSFAHAVTTVGLGTLLPNEYRNYVSQKYATNSVLSSVLIGSAAITYSNPVSTAARATSLEGVNDGVDFMKNSELTEPAIHAMKRIQNNVDASTSIGRIFSFLKDHNVPVAAMGSASGPEIYGLATKAEAQALNESVEGVRLVTSSITKSRYFFISGKLEQALAKGVVDPKNREAALNAQATIINYVIPKYLETVLPKNEVPKALEYLKGFLK